MKDSKISSLIATSEMYRSSARKNSSIQRVESKLGAEAVTGKGIPVGSGMGLSASNVEMRDT